MQHPDHTDAIIELSDVSFAYGAYTVLSHVSLSIHRGDYLAIVGGNGAGKSTLIKLILGLLAPTGGVVRLFGKPQSAFREHSKIGYVPQQATNFDPLFPATAEEVALMGRYARRGLFHGATAADRTRAREALEMVGLGDKRVQLVGTLSGGQQQRVMIARALAADPEVLILDEPTVGVEARGKEEFYALLRRLNREHALTIVLVTHELEDMAHEAMHVACLDGGLFYHEHAETYLAEPHGAGSDHHLHHV
jgi:zinc transport system ATP-binding protein